MQIKCSWQNGMLFSSTNGTHEVSMDAKKPFGADSKMTPKDLVVAGLCGCTAMDVVGLMKKYKQVFESFDVSANVSVSHGVHPVVFTGIELTFSLAGDIDPDVLIEAIELSQTKYCGVSAMLSASVPISYQVELNGEIIGSGKANYN